MKTENLELTKEQKINECVKIYRILYPLFIKENVWYDELCKLKIDIKLPVSINDIFWVVIASIADITDNLDGDMQEYFTNSVLDLKDGCDENQFREIITDMFE